MSDNKTITSPLEPKADDSADQPLRTGARMVGSLSANPVVAKSQLVEPVQPVLEFQGTASIVQPTEAAEAFGQYKVSLSALIKTENKAADTVIRSSILSRLFGSPIDSVLTYEKLVAAYVALWSILERPETQKYSAQALLGIQALTMGRLKTSTSIYREIEFQTSTPAALTYVMRGVGNFIRGLVIFAIVVGYPIAVLIIVNQNNNKHPIENFIGATWFNVCIAAICGALGSVISILLRLSEFETTKGRSQMFLILTGATLPLVGGVFGAFVASLLSAKVVNLQIGGTDQSNLVWLYVVLGFLSGFSERFSRGFISMAEDRLGGRGKAPDAASGQPNAGAAVISGTATMASHPGTSR